MALVKKTAGYKSEASSASHHQKRGASFGEAPTATFYITVQKHLFRGGNEKAEVGRWTSLLAAVRSRRIFRLLWGLRLSAASMSLGLTGL